MLELQNVSFQVEEGSKLSYIESSALGSFYTVQVVNLSACVNLRSIPQEFCFWCINLHTVILPENGVLQSIYGGAFHHINIENITFPASLKYLYSHSGINNCGAFSDCNRLTNIFYYSDNKLYIYRNK